MGDPTSLIGRELGFEIAGVTILSGVDITARSGEVLGLVGPNGAGKSTLIHLLAGLARPTSGSVVLGGRDLVRLRPREIARQLAYVPQETALGFDFTGRDVVLMGRHPHLGRFTPVRPIDHEIAARAMERTDTGRLAGQSVATLSGGERQLVHIAKALAAEPALLLLDEPVAALDLRHQLHVLELLRTLAADGAAVVTVLHDLGQAARFCDRLVLLRDGRRYDDGKPEDVLTATALAEVYGVCAAIGTDADTGALRITPLQVIDRKETR